jgi:hypothetical protein
MTCGFIAAEACYTTPLLALCSSGRIHRHHGSIFHPQGDNRHEARCYTRDDGRPRAPLNGGGQPRTIPVGGRNPGAPGRVMANRMSDRRSELSETRPRSRTESRGRQRPPDQGGPSTVDRGAALAGESATGSVVQERDELARGGPPQLHLAGYCPPHAWANSSNLAAAAGSVAAGSASYRSRLLPAALGPSPSPRATDGNKAFTTCSSARVAARLDARARGMDWIRTRESPEHNVRALARFA